MILFYDTETTGFVNFKLPFQSPEQPHLVQLAFLLCEDNGTEVQCGNFIIKPEGFEIPENLPHKITTDYATVVGVKSKVVCELFLDVVDKVDTYVCHNVKFDKMVMDAELHRSLGYNMSHVLAQSFCTMLALTPICMIPGRYGSYKWPKLDEAYNFFFGKSFENAHDALADVRATKEIYMAFRKMMNEKAHA